MKKIKYIICTGAAMLALLLPKESVAQDGAGASVTPLSIELQKAKALWFNSANVAGMALDNMGYFSSLNLGYISKSGNFKLKSQGENERYINVNTEGGVKLGGGYVWGNFEYDNQRINSSSFNTNTIDPNRGVPFYIVDPNISDWNRQSYTMSFKVASAPIWDRVVFGAYAKYHTMKGAKQVDPRSEVDFYSIDIAPSAIVRFGNHVVGINGVYQNINQESPTSNSNNQQDQPVYVVKGLGNFYTAVVGGLQSIGRFTYSGNKVGGGLQYAYSYDKYKALLSGNYTYRVEDVQSNPTKPKREGSVAESILWGQIQITREGDNLHKLEINYTDAKIDGIEFVQVLDRTFEVQQWVTQYSSVRSKFSMKEFKAVYDLYFGAANEYKWKAGLIGKYSVQDDKYILPYSNMYIENMAFGANVKGNFNLSKRSSLLAGADFLYNYNMESDYNYNGPDAESVVITQFMTPEFLYRASDYYKIGAEASYMTRIGSAAKTGLSFKLSCDYYKPKEGDDSRVIAGVSLGFTF